MKTNKINDSELIVLASSMLQICEPGDFQKEFPTLAAWLDKVSQEQKDQVIKEMVKRIDQADQVTINKDDFISLYAHTQAVLGFEEVKNRFPGLRLLVLNNLTEDELTSTLLLIRSIEQRLN
jgi:flagellar motor switch protein FliG